MSSVIELQHGELAQIADRFGISGLLAIERPIFISGVPRSGTTILSSILNLVINESKADPAESFALEYLQDQQNKFFYDSAIAFLGGTTPYVDTFNCLLEKFRDEAITELDLCRAYFTLAGNFWGSTQLVEKTPSNLLFTQKISAAFPDAAFLFCIREPIQVYISFQQRLARERATGSAHDIEWLSKTPQQFAYFYKYYVDILFQLIEQGFKILIVKYDEFGDKNFAMLKQVLDHVSCVNPDEKLRQKTRVLASMFSERKHEVELSRDEVREIHDITFDSRRWLGYD